MSVSFVVPTRRFDPSNVERIRSMLPNDVEIVFSAVPGGAAHARNVAARRAAGDVLVFMDDDVHLTADWRWREWVHRPWDYATGEWYAPAEHVRTAWMHLACGCLNLVTRVFRYHLTMSGFTAMRRHVFEAAGGYHTETTYEEPAMTHRLRALGFHGAHLPVRVTMLQRWDSFGRFNDATSRGKEHPEPRPGELFVTSGAGG